MAEKSRRKNYPDHRKYQSQQLKPLLKQMECNLLDIERLPALKSKLLGECKEILFEIQLRLD